MDSQELERIRDLTNSGLFQEAAARICRIPVRGMKREDRLRLAFLANEAIIPRKAISLLLPFVRPESGLQKSANAEEIIQYARGLANLGALGEAEKLLRGIDVQTHPRVARIRAFACIRRWDWESAIPDLEKLLRVSSLSSLDRFYGEILLGASLLHGRADIRGSRRLLMNTFVEGKKAGIARTQWDTSQLIAQGYYLEGNHVEAGRYLRRAEEHIDSGIPRLFVAMFQALIDLHSRATRKEALRRLSDVQKGALAFGQWELARSCDYYRAVALKDQDLATHLYFGTPFPKFREKLRGALGLDLSALPGHYDHRLAPAKGRPAGHIDARDGTNGFARGSLKPGALPQRLLQLLCSDFYVEPSLAMVYSALHPNEFYHPISSPDRVAHTIARLRSWMRSQKLPLTVGLTNDRCTMVGLRPVEIRVYLQKGASDARVGWLIQRIQSELPAAEFRASDVERVFGVSRATAVAQIKEAIDAGKVEQVNSGPQTRYRLKP